MQHRNAPLTPNGRRRLVALVEEDGLTFEAAAAASNVARSTAHDWVSRWREAGEERAPGPELPAGPLLAPAHQPGDAQRRDHEAAARCARRTGWGPRLVGSEVGIPHATVHRALRRGGCSRRPAAATEAVIRYEWPCPGNLLHMDKKLHARFEEPGHAVTGDRTRGSRGAGWEFVHSIVDDCSRLAYAEIHDDERARPSPPSPGEPRLVRRAGDRRRATDDRQPLELHEEQRSGRLLDRREVSTCSPGPTRPGPTARSSASSRR